MSHMYKYVTHKRKNVIQVQKVMDLLANAKGSINRIESVTNDDKRFLTMKDL